MSSTRTQSHGVGRKIRKRRAKLRSWWYGTPDNEKALTLMGVGIVLIAASAAAFFLVL